MNQIERLAALVGSQQNLALPEAERLRMPSGWTIWDTGNWHRIHAGRNIETGQLCHQILRLEDATDLDLEGASGVLAEWLTKTRGYFIGKDYQSNWTIYDDLGGRSPSSYGLPPVPEIGHCETYLDAQLAAAEVVLGVGRC